MANPLNNYSVGCSYLCGNVAEIIGKFGAAERLRNTVNQLQTLLYAA
jgi:hypothetical protein